MHRDGDAPRRSRRAAAMASGRLLRIPLMVINHSRLIHTFGAALWRMRRKQSLSCNNKNTAAKKVISSAAIHGPFQQLQPIDLSLNRSGAPRFSECCRYGAVITIDITDERIELRTSGIVQPVLELRSRVRLLRLLYERGKVGRQFSRLGEPWSQFSQMPDEDALLRVHCVE